MNQLHKLLHLPSIDLFRLGKMAIVLLVIRMGLSLLSFKTVRQILDRAAFVKIPSEGDHRNELASLVWATRIAGRYLLGDKPCLSQALAVQMLYRRRGYPADLQIGVAKGVDGRLVAHAWVESNGAIVIGGAESAKRFTSLPSVENLHT